MGTDLIERLPSFRPDIEGLRALAIILVVLSHAQVPMFAGGFIGVDVFFVLSGFLITGLLFSQIESTGSVDLLGFYSRRFRRLLPALLFMLATVVVAAALLLSPTQQVNQTAAAGSVPVWLSNMHFALAKVDYFAGNAQEQLFLHTWSLAVEEQFYLVWPLLLLVAWRGKAGSLRSGQAGLDRFLMAVLIASFAVCLVLSFTHPAPAFYLMPSRAWQFALGALAFTQKSRINSATDLAFSRLIKSPERGSAVLVGAALCLLLASAMVIDETVAYPGAWAVSPSVATVLLLLFADRRGSAIGWFLRCRPMVWLGARSYGWYLWHWPMILLSASLFPYADSQMRLMAGGLAIVPAAISYALIERPVRGWRLLDRQPATAIGAALVLMAMSFLLTLGWRWQAAHWSNDPLQLALASSRRDGPAIYALGCDERFSSTRVRPCVRETSSYSKTVVILGDSVVLQWYDAFASAFPQPQWRIFVLTKSACPIADVSIFYPKIGRRFFECEQWRLEVLRYLAELKPDVLITGSAASYKVEPEQWRKGSERMLRALAGYAGKTLVLQPTPMLHYDPLACLARRDWQSRWKVIPGLCELLPDRQASRLAWETNIEVAERIDSAEVLDFSDLVCGEKNCPATRDEVVVYRDSQHLTNTFVGSVSAAVRERIDAALESLPEAESP